MLVTETREILPDVAVCTETDYLKGVVENIMVMSPELFLCLALVSNGMGFP